MRFITRRLLFYLAMIGAAAWGVTQRSPARADELPESGYISGLVGRAQAYMLSCESRSAADLAAFWGVSVSETEFLSLLPRSDNPELGFVGNPNGMWGGVPPNDYGVHAAPVAALLRAYGLEAEDRRDMSWDDLRIEITAGRPVIVWVIGAMWDGVRRTYIAEDGSEVIVAAFEHSMIVVGYDSTLVHAVDASTGWTYSYAKEAFLRSWQVLDNMAVTVREPGSSDDEVEQPTPVPTETPVPPTPAPTSTPLPTPDPTVLAMLRLDPPYQYFYPQVYRDAHSLAARLYCLVPHQGTLFVESCMSGLGWCIPPERADSGLYMSKAWFTLASP
jgi:uncharacterized protein YvpB